MTIDTTPITALVAVTVFVSLAGNMLAEWLSDLTAQGSAGSTPGELFRVDLDGVRRVVRVVATAKLCFVTALWGRPSSMHPIVGVASTVRPANRIRRSQRSW